MQTSHTRLRLSWIEGVKLPCATLLSITVFCALLFSLFYVEKSLAQGADQPRTPKLPKKLLCKADQTAGLHDYAGPPEEYEASTFFESKFQLRINNVLTKHLATDQPTSGSPELFLTLFPRNDTPVELGCRQVRGPNQQLGYSCSNTPPSELLLINPATLRFTRASIGGWTFSIPAKPDASDESLFVEYGTCGKP